MYVSVIASFFSCLQLFPLPSFFFGTLGDGLILIYVAFPCLCVYVCTLYLYIGPLGETTIPKKDMQHI